MIANAELSSTDLELLESTVARLGRDLGRIADRRVTLELHEQGLRENPLAGPDQVHVSFRLSWQLDGRRGHGSLLLPSPSALALCGAFQGLEEDKLLDLSQAGEPDVRTKLGLLELGSYIAGACDAAARGLGLAGRVWFDGCQGVRADRAPSFPRTPGAALVSAELNGRLAAFDDFRGLLMLPAEAAA